MRTNGLVPSEHGEWFESPELVERGGFDEEEALLPYGNRGFSGHRLLHEFFAFPQRFLFARLQGLRRAVERCKDPDRLIWRHS
jgi:type VI protein secretion system component VasA